MDVDDGSEALKRFFQDKKYGLVSGMSDPVDSERPTAVHFKEHRTLSHLILCALVSTGAVPGG